MSTSLQKRKTLFKIALIEPEIPSNTGNIARTCVATNTPLDLAGPLGFQITDKYLKRAGLDYWPHLKLKYYSSWEEWLKNQDLTKLWLFSIRGVHSLYDCSFQMGETLVFGKETKGLPKKLLKKIPEKTIRVPFEGPVRSLNLSNVAAVALFEALRQKLSQKNFNN